MTILAITVPGGAEWGIILLIFVLLFGAKKLPELGSSVGRSIKNFKRGINEPAEEEPAATTGESAETEAERTPVDRSSTMRDVE